MSTPLFEFHTVCDIHINSIYSSVEIFYLPEIPIAKSTPTIVGKIPGKLLLSLPAI